MDRLRFQGPPGAVLGRERYVRNAKGGLHAVRPYTARARGAVRRKLCRNGGRQVDPQPVKPSSG
ncbi:hypothetical protein GCM10009636_26200 [Arthrobacter koreensis]